ncbi:MAG TPA: PIN domain-containing protein [Thermomicrobiales bacterium]|jgi:predicted nucleic acid-binding protein|nr:PIN domain-containing protein [Thermomicrobiales bacterium]
MASPTPAPTPIDVFIDSSVFFAAVYSAAGSARDLFAAAQGGRIALVLSDYVLAETERNLFASAPRALPAFRRLLGSVPYALSNPTRTMVIDTARVVVAKDAPIIAAARAAEVQLVATYDRKDLLSKRQPIFDAFGVTVATPDEILARIEHP